MLLLHIFFAKLEMSPNQTLTGLSLQIAARPKGQSSREIYGVKAQYQTLLFTDVASFETCKAMKSACF